MLNKIGIRFKYKIRIVLAILILLFTQLIKAQHDEFYKIDLYVDSLKLEGNESFEVLAKKLIKTDWNESEKARAIYNWIAKSIQYDYDGFKKGFWKYYPSDYNIAQDTYEKRKGVCSGYSHLFKLMCNEIGIESEVIDGYSRIETYQAGLPIEEINHAWNAVKINSKWELIDVTWANISRIDNKINDYFFLTSPEEFVVNHLPEDSEWQLLEIPIDKDEFDSYPYISYDYFELGFDRSYPKNGFLRADNGIYKIKVGVPENYNILVKIFNYQNNKWITSDYSTNTKCNNKTLIKITLKNQGKYLVKVSAINQEQSSFKINEGILYYTLEYE